MPEWQKFRYSNNGRQFSIVDAEIHDELALKAKKVSRPTRLNNSQLSSSFILKLNSLKLD